MNFPLIIGVDDNGHVDAHVYGVNTALPDGKVHSGSCVAMGRGAMINGSKNLGPIAKTSTKIKVAFNGGKFPTCAWFRHFRIAQGDDTKEDMLLQDYKSCMILHKNCPF